MAEAPKLLTGPTEAWLSSLADPDRITFGLRLCRALAETSRGDPVSGTRSLSRPGAADPWNVLRASREELLGLSGRLRDAACRLPRPASRPDLAMLLTSIAFERLRRYDLIFACVLLRGAAAIAPPRQRDLGEAARFLAAQQRPDGAFGFFDRPGPAEDPDSALALYLPVTLHCLWTLVELTRPDFRSVVGAPATPGRPDAGFSAALDAWIGL